jgi:hypothetical protein
MYIALQTALLDVDVDKIILPEASSDEAQVRKHSVRQINVSTAICMNDIVLGASTGLPHLTDGYTTSP